MKVEHTTLCSVKYFTKEQAINSTDDKPTENTFTYLRQYMRVHQQSKLCICILTAYRKLELLSVTRFDCLLCR